MKKILFTLCLLFSFQAHATLSSFFETSSLGYTPLNQAGDTALGTLGVAASSDILGFFVKDFAGQASHLQEWQNSSGVALSYIDASGNANLVSTTLNNATASTAAIFSAGKQVISSSTTSTELGYVHNVTSAIQTQLNAKAPLDSPSFTTLVQFFYGTASTVPYFDASKDLVSSSVTPTELGYVHNVTSAIQSQLNAITLGGVPSNVAFQRVCNISSAAAGTPVHCLAAADVPASHAAYVTNFLATVNGATPWATVSNCYIQDTAGSPVNLVTIPAALLLSNAVVGPWTSTVSFGTAYSLGTGATSAKGLDIVCDTTGTGSTLYITVSGVIK